MLVPIVKALIATYFLWAVIKTKEFYENNQKKWETAMEGAWEILCEDYPCLRDFDEDFADPPERFTVAIITGLLFLFWLFLCFIKISFYQTPLKWWNTTTRFIKKHFCPRKQ